LPKPENSIILGKILLWPELLITPKETLGHQIPKEISADLIIIADGTTINQGVITTGELTIPAIGLPLPKDLLIVFPHAPSEPYSLINLLIEIRPCVKEDASLVETRVI